MTWFKVDDRLAFHRKALDAGNAAMGAWVRLGSWSSANETDGNLTSEIIKTIATTEELSSLLRARLLDQNDDGSYELHDFLHYNPSSKKLKKLRKSWAGQKRRQRDVSTADTGADSTQDSSSSPSLARTHASGRDVSSDSDPEGVQGEGVEGESGYDLASRVWCELWKGRYGVAFEVGWPGGKDSDDRILQDLGARAIERGAGAEQLFRHKATAYLADDGKDGWLVKKRHALFFLRRDWNQLGEPDEARPLASTKPAPEVEPAPPSVAEIEERKRRLQQQDRERAEARAQRAQIDADLQRDLAAIHQGGT